MGRGNGKDHPGHCRKPGHKACSKSPAPDLHQRGDGKRKRKLHLSFDTLDLKVPMVRCGNFLESIEDIMDMIKEKLDVFKRQPLKSDWVAVFIDAYWGKLRDPDTKSLNDISIFVALGIDFEGYKHILGYWVLKERESNYKKPEDKAFQREIQGRVLPFSLGGPPYRPPFS